MQQTSASRGFRMRWTNSTQRRALLIWVLGRESRHDADISYGRTNS
jgi:hypothetical protein